MNTTNQTIRFKPVAQTLRTSEEHWVGDGFLVSTILSPERVDPALTSPFLLLDHAAPRHFASTPFRRGVGEHPHRGFDTVTLALSGEVEHRDSSGGGGVIRAGDVQWMTAASGVVHEEMHSRGFASRGGLFEMVQLWVDLPAARKMDPPRYQLLEAANIPELSIGAARARLVAGQLDGEHGPAHTHSPVTLVDLQFQKEGTAEVELAAKSTTLVFLLRGTARAQASTSLAPRDLLVLEQGGTGAVLLEAAKGSRALILHGEPLAQPVVAHGPFVMTSRDEIAEAIRDYQSGAMGRLDART